ncbi:MAG: YolD-like family protein [Peptostreptococcaceae bacterium]
MNRRNAIKYRPFAAVEGHAEAIEALHKKVDLIDKPIPGEDDIERINQTLITSFHHKQKLILKVFDNGKIKELKGTITNFNNNQKTLILDYFSKINIEDIVDVA